MHGHTHTRRDRPDMKILVNASQANAATRREQLQSNSQFYAEPYEVPVA
jgi:hypothetical protein